VDIEHTYLYGPATMSRIFAQHGFEIRKIGSVLNRYSLHYLFRLLPVPRGIKRAALGRLQNSPIGRWRLWVPLGNLYLVARKPPRTGEAE
jgi:hypothetical protein